MELFHIDPSIVHSNDEDPLLKQALVPYDAADYHQAVVLLEPLARAGNLLAIFKYANSLDWLDHQDAAEHFWRIAVDAGHMPSRNNLANNLKDKGRTDQAYDLYLMAAESGEADAMFNLGLLLEKTDWATALSWFKRAVAAGHAKVCANLAIKFFADGDVETAMFYANIGIGRQDGFSAMTVALHYWKLDQLEKVLEFTDIALGFNDPLRSHWIKNALPLRVLSLVGLERLEESRIWYKACEEAGVDEESLTNMQSLIENLAAQQEVTQKCSSCGFESQQLTKFCPGCGEARSGS